MPTSTRISKLRQKLFSAQDAVRLWLLRLAFVETVAKMFINATNAGTKILIKKSGLTYPAKI